MNDPKALKNMFDLGDDFDKGWQLFIPDKIKNFQDPTNHIINLREDYKWYQNYIMWNVFVEKAPISISNKEPASLSDIFVLQHADRGAIQSVLEAQWEADNNGEGALKEKENEQKIKEILQRASKHEAYYKVEPHDYFFLYDAPFLMYLYTLHKQETGRDYIRPQNCPEWFQMIFEEEIDKPDESPWFGVALQRSLRKYSEDKLSLPAFCKTGRLEAYCRFVVCNRRSERVHTFTYFTRHLLNRNKLESVLDFNDEDAWYFEMCTGLALVSELAALFKELGKNESAKAIEQECSGVERWSNCRKEILIDLLERHKSAIIYCPAIYWRIASLKNIICQVDSECIKKELDRGSQSGIMNRENPESYPISKEDWYRFAEDLFETHFFTNLDMIGIVRESFRLNYLTKKTPLFIPNGFTNPTPTGPVPSEFMQAAQNLVIKYPLKFYEIPHFMESAIFADYTAKAQNDGFYFRGCFLRKGSEIHYIISSARNRSGEPTRFEKLDKLRSQNEEERTFELIHQKLYGVESGRDRGVLFLNEL